jgi:hypothetical protein
VQESREEAGTSALRTHCDLTWQIGQYANWHKVNFLQHSFFRQTFWMMPRHACPYCDVKAKSRALLCLYPIRTASELQPSQRTFDETLTVALALFSHSDNVLSKHRADGIAATIQVNPDL